jgi:di/tricarboxylate transporter
MLPVATAPNVDIFRTNRLQIKDMVKAGLLLNVAGIIIIITLIIYLWGKLVFRIDVSSFPDWAIKGQ